MVGYINMDRLIRVHPLYAQLSHLDDDAAVLEFRSRGEQDASQRSHAEILRAEQDVRRDLQEAAERTRKALDLERSAYIEAENEAIARILTGDAVTAPGADAIVERIDQVARQQEKSVRTQASKGLQEYRAQTLDQSRSAMEAIRLSLIERGEREYREKAGEYAQRESTFMLDQAKEDAGERLLLRTRLENLALDEGSRAEAKARLDALDQKEADALGALRNRDQAALAEDGREIHARLDAQVKGETNEIQARTFAKLRERALQMPEMGQLDPIALPAGQKALPPGRLSPDVRTKLTALHRRYQRSFAEDTKRTMQDFMRTRDELSERFRRLARADSEAQSSANQAIEGLRKQHDDLYREIVTQINHEVRAIAKRRGITVVMTNVVAPAGGVDLTTDALSDIESLHE